MGPRKSPEAKARAVAIYNESIAAGKVLSAAKIAAKLAEEFPGETFAVNSINNWIKKAKSEPATEATEGEKPETQSEQGDAFLMDCQTRLMAAPQSAAEGREVPALPVEDMPPVHPLAESWHPLSDADYAKLVESIRENGQHHPIVMHENQILDGRHRYRACLEIGIKPWTIEWDRKGDILDVVANTAGIGRHSTAHQKALAGARMMMWLVKEGRSAMAAGGSEGGKKGGRGNKKGGTDAAPPFSKKRDNDSRSVVKAAKKSGASREAVQALYNILSDGENDQRELIASLVSDGRASVAEAKKLAAVPAQNRGFVVFRVLKGQATVKEVLGAPAKKAKAERPAIDPESEIAKSLADKPMTPTEFDVDAELSRVTETTQKLIEGWPEEFRPLLASALKTAAERIA